MSKKKTTAPEEKETKEMLSILTHMGLKVTEERLVKMKKHESDKYASIKKVTDLFLSDYASNKKIRNIYKADGLKVEPLAQLFELRIVMTNENDLIKREGLNKFAKNEEEKNMIEDALRYLIFSEKRFTQFTKEPDDTVLVENGFLMDSNKKRCYPLGSKDARSIISTIVLIRAKASERKKSKYTTKQQAEMIQSYRLELSSLLDDSHHSSSSSSSSEEKEEVRKKKLKKEGKEKKKRIKKEEEEKNDKKRVNEEVLPKEEEPSKRIKLEPIEEMTIEQPITTTTMMMMDKERLDSWWTREMVEHGFI